MDSGGSVAFDLVVIGAKLIGAFRRGLIFDSSNRDKLILEFIDGIIEFGTIYLLFLLASGIGFKLTTAVTIAGAGKLELPLLPVGGGIIYVV